MDKPYSNGKSEVSEPLSPVFKDGTAQPVFDFDTPLTQRTAADLFANNPYIKSSILFRETDNAHEMESHIAQGLKNLDGTPKMAYNYYKAMGTAQQETYKAQASAIIGADVNSMVANRTFLTRNGWFLND